jgi:hypothetical protein
MVPVVDKDPLAPSALPTPDSWEWFTETGAARAPAWRNEVTLRSVEMFTEYEPGIYLPYISPTPLLLLVAEGDHLVPSELAIAAFDRAHQPKELVILPGGHFDAYTKGFEASSGPARDWFTRHLGVLAHGFRADVTVDVVRLGRPRLDGRDPGAGYRRVDDAVLQPGVAVGQHATRQLHVGRVGVGP